MSHLQPLNGLLAKYGNNSVAVACNDALAQALEKAKETFAEVGMLVHPMYNAPSSVMIGASDTAVGAVFQQFVDVSGQPISVFSE